MEYFISWLVDNFLLVWLLIFAAFAAWKVREIWKQWKNGGLLFWKFLKGRGGAGFAVGVVGMLITIVALFFPWYVATAKPAVGASTQLIYVNGFHGIGVSVLTGGNATAAPTLSSVVAVDAPLGVIFAIVIPLLMLDTLAVTRGTALSRKYVDSAIILLIALVLVLAFASDLPGLVPAISSAVGGQQLSAAGSSFLTTISSNPAGGSGAVGTSTVSWGFGTGTYLFIVAALAEFAAGGVIGSVPDLAPKAPQQPEESGEPTRRLAAIMFTDIVGYTALTQTDESKAMKLLKKHRKLIRPIFPKYSGREVKTIGDAFLVEFNSALEATECAVEMEKTLHDLHEPDSEKVRLKIGIHVGDVIHEGGDVYGDAVNIASRIEPLATGGGICISEQVYDQIRNKVQYKLVKLEPKELKNVSFQIDTYRVQLPWEADPAPAQAESPK